VKVKLYLKGSGQALGVPEGLGFQISRQSAHEVVSVLARGTSRLYSTGDTLGYSLMLETESTTWPVCGRKDYVNENSHDPIENRTHDFRAFISMPQLCTAAHKDRMAVQ
jgi:hypothetical protein